MRAPLIGKVVLGAVLIGGGSAASAGAATAAKTAEGDFVAAIDFATVDVHPVGANCRLTVSGVLTFSGTVTGAAEGTTQALIHAPCSAVATSDPGTYGDVFRFEGQFEGEVAGQPVTAELVYAGVTRPGGDIDALIRIRNGVSAVLRADAVVGRGGSYEGTAVLRR